MSGELVLTFHAPNGQDFSMAVKLDEQTARTFQRVASLRDMGPWEKFEQVVEVMRTKHLRKELFIAEATRLGTLLAERMEDAEGWHDASRIEPAKAQLSREGERS